MKVLKKFTADMLTGVRTVDLGLRSPKFLRAVGNTVAGTTLVLVALLAAIGSALLARSSPAVAAMLAILALLLSLVITVTVVPRLARRAKIDLFLLQLLGQITVSGWLFLAIITISGFAAFNSGNNLLYLIFSILIGLLFAASMIARTSLRDLGVKLRLPDHIYAGEPTLVSVALENHKAWFASFSVLIEADTTASYAVKDDGGHEPKLSEGALSLAYFPFVPRASALRQHTRHTFQRRGCYHFQGFTLTTKFPTGFFKRRRHVEAEGELVVYPKPQPISDFFHTLPINDGQFQSRLKGVTGSDLYAIREYLPTDIMRRVDWKATAKLNRLMVKDFTRDDEWRINLVFDAAKVAAPDYDFAEKFERGVILAASLANHFVQEGAELQLITPGETLPYGFGRDHLYRVLRQLARLRPHLASDQASPSGTAWWLFDELPALEQDRHFKIVITSAEHGSIPASLWRSSHVVFLRDL